MVNEQVQKGIALVAVTPGTEFAVEDVELDALREEEVLVRLVATGVCHTDLAVATGKIPITHPLVAGHEGAGVVEQIGPRVTSVSVNDHVILSFASCGHCRSCRTEKPFCCINSRALNFAGARADGSRSIRRKGEFISSNSFGQSSFCNPAVFQARCRVPVDRSYPLRCLAGLGCSIQTGAGAVLNVVLAHRPKVSSIAVFGLGGVGCAAIMAARITQIPVIVAVDIQAQRLELARELGATHAVNSSGGDAQEELQKVGGGVGLDAVLECTGVQAVIQSVLRAVAPGGLALSIGAPGRAVEVAINVTDHIRGCHTYRGTHEGDSNPAQFIPTLVQYWADGRLPLDRIQTYYRADQINEAVESMKTGGSIKPILLWE